jgi:hypothetical protein
MISGVDCEDHGRGAIKETLASLETDSWNRLHTNRHLATQQFLQLGGVAAPSTLATDRQRSEI